MARQTINTGTSANDGTGDTLRQAGTKINANFTELYGLLGGDSATLGQTSVLTDSGATFFGTNYRTRIGFVEGAGHLRITLPDSSGNVVIDSAEQTLTNKTLTEPHLDSATLSNTYLQDSAQGKGYFIVTPKRSTHVNLNIPTLTDSDTIVTLATTQTFTNKTITAPTISNPLIHGHFADSNGAEVLHFSSTASAVNHFDMQNAATGGLPIFAAHSNDDSDVSLDLKGQNRGAVVVEKIAYGTSTLTADGNVPRTATYISCNKGSTLALTLKDGNVTGEQKIFTNKGAGNAVITPDNLTGSNTTITIQQHESVQCIWDGSNWFVVGGEGYALA